MNWWENFFDKDYIKFWKTVNFERTENEVKGIINLLNLKGNEEILDVPCAQGRIAIRLAELGYTTTGLDYSEYLINLALSQSKHLDNCNFVVDDMRRFSSTRDFDTVLGIFSPLGMFGKREDDISFIEAVYNTLKEGGKFLLDNMHRDYIITLSGKNEWWEIDNTYLMEKREFDFVNSISYSKLFWFEDGLWKEKNAYTKVYSVEEIIQLLQDCNFRIDAYYGDYNGKRFSLSDPRIIIVATK
ncbi:class I SAM-dependent methyltransferase [Paenibacillus gansuensis]|uniref:Methyltransferase domain-containing protein n=1 Tax=Paenibacillus gansuensis TaxID=306542 RepID=A0ABW5PHH6_9BACL